MSEAMLCGHVQRLQVGEALPFAREQTSAINKSKVDAVTVTTTGFVGDEQADPFFMAVRYRRSIRCQRRSMG